MNFIQIKNSNESTFFRNATVVSDLLTNFIQNDFVNANHLKTTHIKKKKQIHQQYRFPTTCTKSNRFHIRSFFNVQHLSYERNCITFIYTVAHTHTRCLRSPTNRNPSSRSVSSVNSSCSWREFRENNYRSFLSEKRNACNFRRRFGHFDLAKQTGVFAMPNSRNFVAKDVSSEIIAIPLDAKDRPFYI